MDPQTIVIRGAREHNLQNVHLELPRNQLIVFTGVSGSGKSSLAFDTLYAEGQRRYVESLSPYARQKPAFDRRHDHRDSRLFPRPLRTHWTRTLPPMRPGNNRPDARADRQL